MERIYLPLLLIHAATGYTALLSGSIILAAKKGTKPHRILGKVFVIAMLGVISTALTIALWKGNTFLLHIGIFTFYQVYSGWRALRTKSLRQSTVDVVITVIAGINALAMLASFKLILMVFGGIGAFLVVGDFTTAYRIKHSLALAPRAWLAKHIGMMMGAYIATFTAFLVVNITTFQQAWLLWLAPTALLVPLMRFWTLRYTGQLASAQDERKKSRTRRL